MKILIIRLGSLGDVILTTAIPGLIKEMFPHASIDFLVKKDFSAVLENNPAIDEILCLDNKGEHKGAAGLFRIIGSLKKRGYSHIIDLHSNLRSRVISTFLKSTVMRYDKQILKRRLLKKGLKADTVHTVEAYTGALAGFGIAPSKVSPLISISKEESDKAKNRLKAMEVGEEELLVGFNAGAKWPTKMWPEESFAELGRMLSEKTGCRVIIFGGPEEKDLGERLSEKIGHGALSLAGHTGLRESAALMEKCRLFVSNDSGPMHMATAVGIPVIAIFGPTVKGFGFFPLGDKNRIVEKDIACRPCSLHGGPKCPEGHFRCMKDIGVEEVFKEAMDELSRAL